MLQMRNPRFRGAEGIHLVTGRTEVRTQGSLTPGLVFHHTSSGSLTSGCMQIPCAHVKMPVPGPCSHRSGFRESRKTQKCILISTLVNSGSLIPGSYFEIYCRPGGLPHHPRAQITTKVVILIYGYYKQRNGLWSVEVPPCQRRTKSKFDPQPPSLSIKTIQTAGTLMVESCAPPAHRPDW